MTKASSPRRDKSTRVRRTRSAPQPIKSTSESQLVLVERSGDWMPADELRELLLDALARGKDLTLNLDRIDHLDASALQVLLAAKMAIEKSGRSLQFVKASAQLCKWFELAGVDDWHFQDRAS